MIAEYMLLSGRDQSKRAMRILAMRVRQEEQAVVEVVQLYCRTIYYQNHSQAGVLSLENQGEHRR